MQPRHEGIPHRVDRREYRILFVSAGDEEEIVESLRTHYRVETAGSRTAVARPIAADCLVVDAETFRAIEADGTASRLSVPIVVFSAVSDPILIQSIARRRGCDIVYRDVADVATPGEDSELERLRDQIDAVCRDPDRSRSDGGGDELGDAVLETAGLLLSAAPDEVDTKIEWGLGSISETLGADRTVVYEHEGDRLVPTHEWSGPGRGGVDHGSVRASAFPGFERSLSRFEPFRSDEGDPSTESRSRLGYDGDGAFVAVPIVIDWTLQRLLVVDGISRERRPEMTTTRLQTAGELIGRTLRRNRRHREIKRQNERLEQFASVISHDLQNPLNVIVGYAELARTSDDPEHIDRIVTAAGRMEDILEDLRTLAREAEDLGELEPVAVSELAERACQVVETEAITVEIDSIDTVEADPSRLRQAFENLLRNAVEHAGSDVTVRIEPIDGGFAVTDDGDGFDPEDRGRLFEEGYTGGGGTGLGLAIVRTVIEAHGWAIEATDAENGGARFEITGVQFCDERSG